MSAAGATCLCTVATPDFVPGAAVMIRSFLGHNAWFRGDVLVLHDGLSAEEIAALSRLDERIRCRASRADLVTRIDDALAARPDLGRSSRRFLSGEVLTLTDYARVLFCDADILFRGDVSGLFELQGGLCACPDAAHLRALVRTPADIAGTGPHAADGPASTFNAGVMLFSREALGDAAYQCFLACIDRFATGEMTGPHRDQAILNHLFRGACTFAPPQFNVLLAYADLAGQVIGGDMTNAPVVHFNGPFKPWNPDQSLALIGREPRARTFVREWSRTYFDCLVRMQATPDFANRTPVAAHRS